MKLGLHELEVRYENREALQPTTLTLDTGAVVALVGPNGAGKSTLLKALAGLLAHSGTVTWQGLPLVQLDVRARARTIAYLPQMPSVHWPLAARELVALGRLPYRAYGGGESAADTVAIESAMRQTDTLAFAGRSADRLSVGERARVLLARALAVEAPVLLVDEPIAMLDPYHQLDVMRALRGYALPENGASEPRLVIAVLHDLGLAARFCDRVLLMRAGALVGDGPPNKALTAGVIRATYGVEPYLARHDDEPVIVPWRSVARDYEAR